MSSGLFYTPQIVEDFATYLLENEFEGDMDDEFNELLDWWLDSIIYDTDEYLFHKDKTNDMALIKYIVDNDSMGLADCLFEIMKDNKMGIQLCRIKLRSWAFYTVIREELTLEIEEKFNELKKEEDEEETKEETKEELLNLYNELLERRTWYENEYNRIKKICPEFDTKFMECMKDRQFMDEFGNVCVSTQITAELLDTKYGYINPQDTDYQLNREQLRIRREEDEEEE